MIKICIRSYILKKYMREGKKEKKKGSVRKKM